MSGQARAEWSSGLWTFEWTAPRRRPHQSSLVDHGVGANRERPKSLDRRGHSSEAESLSRELLESGEMLDQRDAGSEQLRMRRSRTIRCVIDVERVDAHQRRAVVDQPVSSRAGQEGVALAI